jgi:SAM-dependent methyltransferase
MSVTSTPEDTALKARHRAMWALGDYPAVATDVIAELGEVLVDTVGITAEEKVVDIGAGSGNASIPAARRGADVVATDLTPELLEVGRAAADEEGLTLRWRTADAEAMPCDDGQHDVAISCVGIMFAPHHQVAADELVRVVRSGGRIGLLSWTPAGFIGQMFATMKPYAPAPPPGASPAPLWGDLDHVRTLLGDRVSGLEARQQTLRVDCFADGAAFRDFFKTHYGPTVAVYRYLAAEPERVAALDRDLADLAARHDLGGGVMHWEYLLWTGRRAG